MKEGFAGTFTSQDHYEDLQKEFKEKEFDLSKKREELAKVLKEEFGIHNSKAWSIIKRVVEQDKEAVRLLKEEYNDFEKDIIALIEINDYGKKDLIAKMKRLCKAHKEEIDKIFGKEITDAI